MELPSANKYSTTAASDGVVHYRSQPVVVQVGSRSSQAQETDISSQAYRIFSDQSMPLYAPVASIGRMACLDRLSPKSYTKKHMSKRGNWFQIERFVCGNCRLKESCSRHVRGDRSGRAPSHFLDSADRGHVKPKVPTDLLL